MPTPQPDRRPAAGAPAPLFPLALGLWFTAETGAWLATLAWMAARGAGWLRRSPVRRWLERVTGVALTASACGWPPRPADTPRAAPPV